MVVSDKLALAGKIVAFVVGVWLSSQHISEFWYVGSIFGIVVLIWHAKSIRDLWSPRSGGFLLSSTLIYALVMWTPMRVMQVEGLENWISAEIWRLFLVFLGPIALGTILLPVMHSLFLKVSWKRTLIAIPSIFGIWWLVVSVTSRLASLQFSFGIDHSDSFWGFLGRPLWLVTWQATYLLFLIGKPGGNRNGKQEAFLLVSATFWLSN